MSQSRYYLIGGTWLEGTCNLAMPMTMKGFKFFVDAGREWMGTGGWSGEGTAGKVLTLIVAGHKRSFPWLPEQRGMLPSYNPCHPCMTSCAYLGHPTSYHSLTSFSSCIPPCPSAPIPPSPSLSMLQSKVVISLQHFSVLLLSYCWDMA